MKISKKDLRRIIIENVLGTRTLKEGVNLNSAWRAASNFKKAPQDKAARAELARFKEKLEKHKADNDGPFRRDKGRATEAQTLLDNIIKLLDADPESASEVSLASQPPENPKADDATGEGDGAQDSEDPGGWKKYGDETGWLYKIEGESTKQIWVTKKAGSAGPEYKLNKPKYAKTVKNLDAADNLPKRTKDSIKNDPALKTPSAKPAAKPVAKPVDNDQKAAAGTRSPDQDSKITTASSPENKSLPTYNFGSSDADWRTTTLRTYSEMPLPRISATGTFFDLDNDSKTRDTALQNIIDWLYTRDVATGLGGDFSDMTVDARYNLSKARGITGGNWEGKSAAAYKDHIIGIQSGVDSEPMKKIINATIEAFARINNAYNHSLNMKAKNGNSANESKVIYGKSHATLLRERYWGRY